MQAIAVKSRLLGSQKAGERVCPPLPEELARLRIKSDRPNEDPRQDCEHSSGGAGQDRAGAPGSTAQHQHDGR